MKLQLALNLCCLVFAHELRGQNEYRPTEVDYFGFTPQAETVPLNPFNGNAVRVVNDLSVAAVSAVGLNWTRYNNTRDQGGSRLGQGWSHSFRWEVRKRDIPAGVAYYVYYPDGNVKMFGPHDPGQITGRFWALRDADYLLVTKTDITLVAADNTRVFFPLLWPSSGPARATSITDARKNVTTLAYTTIAGDDFSGGKSTDIVLTKVTDASGHYLQINYTKYGTAAYINSVATSDGRSVSYSYTKAHEYLLTGASYSDGTTAAYSYTAIPDPTGWAYYVLATAADVRAIGVRNIRYDFAPYNEKYASGFVKAVWNNADQTLLVRSNSNASGNQTPTNATLTYPDGRLYTYTLASTDGMVTATYKVINSISGTTTYLYNLNHFSDGNPPTISTTDARGNVGAETTDTRGKVLSRTAPGGAVATWTYDAGGYRISATDENGKTTTFARDPSREWITRITYPDSTQESFTYNNFGQVLTHAQRNGGVESNSYSTDGLILMKQDATGAITTYTYNSQYRVASMRDGNNSTTSFFYDERGQTTKVTNPDGSSKAYTYGTSGNILTETNELGNITSYTYDSLDRVLTTRDPLGRTVLNSYDANAPTNDRPSLTTYPSGRKVAATYNAAFGYKMSSSTLAPGTSVAATTTYGYDIVGNLIRTTDPRGNISTVGYDARNRKIVATNALSQTTRWGYDPASNVISVQRPDNTTESKTYDAMNRVLTETDPLGRITTFSYWPSGMLKTVKDAKNQVTQFEYDARDLKTKMVYQNGDYQAWVYDSNKNVVSRRTTAGVYQKFSYDSRNRKTVMWWGATANLADQTDLVWTNGVNRSVFTYALNGPLASANNSFSSITRSYDAVGRLVSESQNLTGIGNRTVQYENDVDGRASRLYVADGNGYDRTYTYDEIGRLDKIKNTSDQVDWFGYSYDAASNETQRFSYFNSVAQVYSRDALNRMTRRDLKIGSGASFAYEAYGYDVMSRVLSIDREDSKRDLFGYSLAGELTSAKYGLVGGINPSRTVNYTLDSVGNRTQVVDAGVSKTYASDNINRYTTVGYDTVFSGPAHQVGIYQANRYDYVGDSYLASVAGPGDYKLGYDALGRCVKRTLNKVSTYYVYDGEKPLLEYNANGARVGWNVYGKGVDEILMRADYVVVPSGQGYFYQQGHKGSVTHLTGFGGEVIERYRYDAFGAPTTTYSAGNFNNRFKFTGREYVAQFGIYEYRARAYHPTLGRFMSEDPKGFDAGDRNLFRDCHNDPLDLTDPMGLLAMNSYLVSGFTRYGLVYTGQSSATSDGYEVRRLDGYRNKPGDRVHLEINRTVTRVHDLDGSKRGAGTKPHFSAFEKNDVATIRLDLNVRYASGAGAGTQTFSQDNEWTHSRDAISAANTLRGSMNAWTTGMSAPQAVNFITQGAKLSNTLTIPSLKTYENIFINNQRNEYDDPRGPNSWLAPNGRDRVAPHNPVDPETGNPLDWNQ